MSYRRDSEFFVPYYYYRRLEPEEVPTLDGEPKNYARGKDKLIAWMAGNCGHLRDEVVRQLLLHVDVTVFGACAKNFNQNDVNHCRRGSRDCEKLLRRFKFYLSFENAMCVDYVTEKYWTTPFHHDIVPIVLGSNYDSKVAIPGSYINVLDFQSLKSLSEYLKYLNSNGTAYNEYFRWKTKFKLDYPISVVWTCKMCEALNNQTLPTNVYRNIDSFWGVASTCGRNHDKIYKMLETS
ncbi:hypothetical protein QZH41_000683 [Actinostola sp. cb2023]|nr:hypothetical protein QZH41_000683 [Actinostola sp. cb2023]